ncbi:uncharacterized protein ARMOST_20947 [Armillaria ostoyae]|uniref:Uncharacterized protein n=1 Tax=Armillaria ostoyae TaxID=47428 RepID=A0A284S8Q3_ARMOS|nr:uncharacterized protein ARMOST_20947 [Armillaria ostoyae]
MGVWLITLLHKSILQLIPSDPKKLSSPLLNAANLQTDEVANDDGDSTETGSTGADASLAVSIEGDPTADVDASLEPTASNVKSGANAGDVQDSSAAPCSHERDSPMQTPPALENPFDGIMSAVSVLPRVKDLLRNHEMEERVKTIELVDHLSSKPILLTHLLHLAFHLSKPNLSNLALVDPSQFCFNQGRIVMGSGPMQSFFLVRQVVHSDLFSADSTKQICIKPLYTHWARAAAVVGKIIGVKAGCSIVFSSFRGGVSLSSYMKKLSDPTPSTVPVNGKKHGPAVRPWNESMPVFDCHGSFQLTKYHKCPPDSEDPKINSFVVVIFTIGRFKDGDDYVVSLNIQVVLRVGDAKDDFAEEGSVPKHIRSLRQFGVEGTIADMEVLIAAADDSDVDHDAPFI